MGEPPYFILDTYTFLCYKEENKSKMKKLWISLRYFLRDWIFSFAILSFIVFAVVNLGKMFFHEDMFISTGAGMILFISAGFLILNSTVRKGLVNRLRVLLLLPSKEDLEEMKVKRT